MRADFGTSELHRPFGAISSCDEIETRAPALATPPAVSSKFLKTKNMNNLNSRLKKYNDNLNLTFGDITGKYEPFTDKFTNDDYIKLKKSIQDIHNILTLKLTLNFIETIGELFNFPKGITQKLKVESDEISPNARGFDIKIDNPTKILAEVKCITPENEKDRFNAAQKKNLFKDAIKLKLKEHSFNTEDYYKFIVILDFGTSTDEAIEAILKYDSKKLNNEREDRMTVLKHLIYLTDNWNKNDLDKSKIYIVKQKL
jgi:hypothetical protein